MEWLVPIVWLLLAIIFVVIEIVTLNLVSVWFAIGASSAMFVAVADYDNYGLQGIVFIVVSAIALVVIRNWSLKRLKAGSIKTNVNSLIGKTAVVTKKIEAYNVGEVKVDGMFWSAKLQSTDTIIEEGTIVEILEVIGVKLIVKKINKNE
ncbi:MAG: nodulation protein NfeD [Haloplasmataceae bacterium]|nr:nodulation protein NfeD [Haloplasmataceae bacterium]